MTRALMIGFGSVGQALVNMILDRSGKLAGRGFSFQAIGVFTRTRGNRLDPKGLDLKALLYDISAHGKFMGETTDMAALEACRTLDYDVLIELSPLTIADHGEPAVSHIKTALSRGLDVVTANKGPIAFAYDELRDLARKSGGRLLFESTVMDGAPVFNLVSRCMKGNAVTGFSGILNSTTNYILTRMEEGDSLAAATQEAIDAGIAEADPSNDVDGWDAAVKTAVLARALMGAGIDPFDVMRQGIGNITDEAIQNASARGKRVKLVCRGWKENDAVKTSVAPEELDKTHLFAGLSLFDAGLCIETELMAPNCIIQKDPTPRDTAFGILEDLLSLDERPKEAGCAGNHPCA